MKRIGWVLLTLALILSLAAPAAQAAGNGETTYRALLIGIDAYQTNELTGCVNDTARMSATLQAANEAGAFYQSPTTRSNLQTDEITAVFSEVDSWNVDDDDVTFFYYSGHGFMSDKGTPAIVGKDRKMLSIADLVVKLDAVPGVKVVVLDTRYADSLLSKLSKADGTLNKALSTYDAAVLDVFKNSPDANKYFVLSASTLSSSVEQSFATGEDPRGLITYYLTQGSGYDYAQQRPTDELPADANGNGAVSLGEVRDYIESSILKLPNATDLVYDVQILPANSAFPLLARRATAEVLEVSLETGPIEIPVGRNRLLEAVTQPVNASKHTIYWSSSDLSIADVDEDGNVRGIKPGTTQIAATTSNGLTVSTEVEVRDITLAEALTLNVPRLALGSGSSIKLNLTVTPANASETITWNSDDPTIATVDQEGNVTCVGIGETYITVKTDSGVEATCSLQVVENDKVVTAVEVNKKALEIMEGESRNVQTRIKPANATDPIVQFTSSDLSIATISGDSIITGVSSGTCTVYATASSGIAAEIKVTVKGATVALNKGSMLLKEGASATIKAQVKPTTITSAIKWESTDPAVATVEDGKITAVGAGSCVITASIDGGASATCRIMVGGTPVKNVKITPAKLQLNVGDRNELNLQVRPENASLESLVWQSNNEQVVQVDNTGALTAVGPGRAIVTVKTIGNTKSRCLVTVKGEAGTSSVGGTASELMLDQTEATLVVGLPSENQLTLTVDAPVSDGQVSVKFASSNPKVATVNQEGVVTAKAPGKATIRAKSGKSTVDCAITVVSNRVQNKKPITGDEESVYTSARQIYYKGGQLVVDLYYTNRTKAGVTAPEAGTIYLTLADGTSLPFKQVEAGKGKLAAGKTVSASYKVKVADGEALYGLDLRGATAALYKTGEEPQSTFGVLPTGGDETQDDAQDGAMIDPEEVGIEDEDPDDQIA